jgi:hypothetical protein
MSVINQYTFFLDSKYRSRGENATPVWKLPEPIMLENPNNLFECKVLSCEIPFSFKTLQSPNNTLRVNFKVVEDAIDVSGNITIPEGNYSILTLLTELQTRLNTFIAGTNFVHPPTLTFSYDKETGRTTFDIFHGNGNHTVTLTLYWTLNDILAEYFGFSYTANTVLKYTNAGITNSTNYISPNNVNVSPITNLYIRSDSLQQVAKNQERLVEQIFSVSDIILKVPVTSSYNSWLIYENSNFTVKLNNKHIEDISLYLTTLTYDKVLLQGVHWRVAIQINEIEPEFVKYLKYNEIQNQTKLQDLTQQKEELLNKLKTIKDEIAAQQNV